MVILWKITEGSYGPVDLKNRAVVLAAKSPNGCSLADGGWRGGYYIDRDSTPDQREALETIYTGKAGGHPVHFFKLVGDFLGFKYVPIEIRMEEKQRTALIPNILNLVMSGMKGYRGAPIEVHGNPFAFAIGYPYTLMVTDQYKYKDEDFNFDWEWIGRNGYHSPFSYAGP
jgi:hypothetical protein